jgi:hypothetical protein
MAARYFRNTGSSSATLATNWSATDGGGSVGAVPTSVDDVYFTSNSGNCNVDGTCSWKTINCTGYVGTLSGASQLTVAGNITFVSGMSVTYTGLLIINAAATIILAGKQLSQLRLSNTAVTLDSGGAKILSLTINQAGSTLQISSSAIINSLISTASTAASVNLIRSNTGGVQRQVSIMSGDLNFCNFTDIDASGGNTVRSYKATISNCKNIVQLTPPTQKGSITL